MTADYLYIKSACANLDGNLAIVHGRPMKLDGAARAILDSVIAGGGSLNLIAQAVAAGEAETWAAEFADAVAASPILGRHRIPARTWPKGTALVCDWCQEQGAVALPGDGCLRWCRDPNRALPGRIVLGGATSLYFEVQILRGILGATSGRQLFLIGAADRVLLGDLLHRHRAIVLVSPDWPQSRRVWQHSPAVLQEDRVWLEYLFYMFRHCDETSQSDLSARSGSVMAAQDTRAICDASRVYCWTPAQQLELKRFYGRTAASSPLVGETKGLEADSGLTVRAAIEFLLRTSYSRHIGHGAEVGTQGQSQS